MPGCLSEESLLNILDGRDAIDAVLPHLDQCPACRALLSRAAQEHAAADPVLQPGAQVGNFVLTERLGEGSMGEVFAGRHVHIGTRAAIKVLRPESALDPDAIERLFTEARALSAVQHAGLVRLFDCGQLPDGTPYLITEYLDGEDLRVYARRIGGQPGARADLARLLQQVAAALQAAHERGIVHRDLKPENILVVSDEPVPGGRRAKVLDFGLAKLRRAQVGDAPAGRSQAGLFLGTPRYTSPEQCRGEDDVDGRADVYALGVILYELTEGRPPFTATHVGAVLDQHLREAPPPPRRAARGLSRLMLRMLSKDPAARPTMKEVAERLARPSLTWQTRLLWALVAGAAAAALLPGAARLAARLAGSTGGAALAGRGGLVALAGGRFRMGSNPEESQAAHDYCLRLMGEDCPAELFAREQPDREVYVSGFSLDRTEVTNGEFADWLNRRPGLVLRQRQVWDGAARLADLYLAYGHSGLEHRDGRFAARKGLERRPVVQVTWLAAGRYCRDRGLRLPTEAEWEFAARGRERARFPWGDDEPRCEGVVFARTRGKACAHLGVGPADVGEAAQDRSPQGVLGLAGNVSEWVLDRFVAPYPPCPPDGCRDPVAPGSDEGQPGPRVFRGGDFHQSADACRAGGRGRMEPDQVKGNVGFRCAGRATR